MTVTEQIVACECNVYVLLGCEHCEHRSYYPQVTIKTCHPGLISRYPSVSVVHPFIFICFRIPVYPAAVPTPGYPDPGPVSGEKIWQRKWERVFPLVFIRFHP